MPSLARLALLWLLAGSLLACNLAISEGQAGPGATATLAALPSPSPTPDHLQQQVEALLASLSLRDRVGQLFLLGYFDASPTLDIYAMARLGRPGGVVLFAHNVGDPATTAGVINRLQETAVGTVGVPLLIAADQEGGIVSRLNQGFTPWPNMMALAATGDLSLAERVGRAMAEEMRAVGVNMNLAPVVDVLSNPYNTVISVRSFGGVPGVVSAFGQAVLRGLHAGGVIGTAKHFPGHGGTLEDSHFELPTDPRPREELAQSIAPFAAMVQAGVDVVMTAHVVYPALSGDGLAATFSPAIVGDLLRGQLGFEGVILSDALSMGAVLGDYTLNEAVERAIRAGVDMVTFGRGVTPEQQLAAIDHIVALVQAGALDEARINESARRILALKARYGLLAWSPIDPAGVSFDLEGHQALSYEVAANAVTLLRDRGGLLPLDPAGRVTVVYPMEVDSAPAAFQTYDPDVNLIGISLQPTQADWDGALAAAAGGGTVVLLTLDAAHYSGQGDLARALPAERTVTVALRSPFDLLAYPAINTHLLTYASNGHALYALARVLYGQAGAPGLLPVDIPGLAQHGFSG